MRNPITLLKTMSVPQAIVLSSLIVGFAITIVFMPEALMERLVETSPHTIGTGLGTFALALYAVFVRGRADTESPSEYPPPRDSLSPPDTGLDSVTPPESPRARRRMDTPPNDSPSQRSTVPPRSK